MKKLIMLMVTLMLLQLPAVAKTEFTYVDASNFGVINKGMDDGKKFNRLDISKYPGLTERMRQYFTFPTGIAVRFRTNSPVIRAIWEVPDTMQRTNGPALATKGLDLYIRDTQNNKWLWAGCAMPKYLGKKYSATIVEDMEPGMKECMLYLPLFQEVRDLKIGVEKGSVIESDPAFKPAKIVAMGSSFTHGASASRPGMAWPQQLSRMLDMDIVNYGTSGICKMEPVLADIIADTDADIFIFDTFSNPSAKEVHERFAPFVKRIREKHPNTPLVFLHTFYRENGNFNLKKRQYELDRTAAAEEELAKVMKTDKNIYYLNPGLYAGDDHESTCDGTHPSDLGYQRAAVNIAEKIRPILKKYNIKK